ncbi:MAG: LysR family transcriptional regulator [Acidocella sp.]|nr:LysR family transcriptional regulator [Acidocella sp.]
MITPDSNLLRLLNAIAKHGSFNKAASALGISQPALSVKIAYLERQAGSALLVRSPRGATLTPEGELLSYFAETIQNVRARAGAELLRRQQGGAGGLHIGATPITLVNLIPAALNQLDTEVGSLTVHFAEGPDEDLNRRLLQHELDIVVGVVGFDADIKGISETALHDDHLDLVVRPGTPLDRKREIALGSLHGRRWVLPSPGSAFERQVQAMFITAGVPLPRDTVYCGSLLAIRRIAALGDRLAILPRQAVIQDCEDGILTTIPIAGPGTTRRIGYRLRTSETPAPLTLRFVELLAVHAKRLGGGHKPRRGTRR